MRFLIKASLPTEKANQAFKKGAFGATVQTILAQAKPEAVYFTSDAGMRCVYVVVDLQDASQLPAITEPLFLGFSSNVEVQLAMTPEDLMKAGPAIEQAARQFS